MSSLLLLSGGIDSTALAALRRPACCLTIDYGQLPAAAEAEAAAAVAGSLGIPWQVVTVDARAIGSGDLAGRPATLSAPASEWWPYRNQLLATIGAAHALHQGLNEVVLASVREDGFHVDGSAPFYERLSRLIAMQEGGIRVIAPAVNMTTIDLIREASVDRGLLDWTHSCHRSNFPCGLCRGCLKRLETFGRLGWT